jgi:hypothetical protein
MIFDQLGGPQGSPLFFIEPKLPHLRLLLKLLGKRVKREYAERSSIDFSKLYGYPEIVSASFLQGSESIC